MNKLIKITNAEEELSKEVEKPMAIFYLSGFFKNEMELFGVSLKMEMI